jgi:hypothetical protein
MGVQGAQVGVAHPFEIIPLPAAQIGGAVVEQLLGPADVVGGPLALRQADAAEIQVGFGLFALLGLGGAGVLSLLEGRLQLAVVGQADGRA